MSKPSTEIEAIAQERLEAEESRITGAGRFSALEHPNP